MAGKRCSRVTRPSVAFEHRTLGKSYIVEAVAGTGLLCRLSARRDLKRASSLKHQGDPQRKVPPAKAPRLTHIKPTHIAWRQHPHNLA